MFVLALVGVLTIIAFSRAGGEPAQISPKGLGPLEIGEATMEQMQRWAVGPVTFWFVGDNDPPPPVRFTDKLWQYECIDRDVVFDAPCRTLFGLRGDRVVTVMTSNPRYSTPAGTRIGTPLEEARKNERGGRWSGWNVECPRITLRSPKGVVFLARVARNEVNPGGFVNGFYLSVRRPTFDFCPENGAV